MVTVVLIIHHSRRHYQAILAEDNMNCYILGMESFRSSFSSFPEPIVAQASSIDNDLPISSILPSQKYHITSTVKTPKPSAHALLPSPSQWKRARSQKAANRVQTSLRRPPRSWGSNKKMPSQEPSKLSRKMKNICLIKLSKKKKASLALPALTVREPIIALLLHLFPQHLKSY